MKHIRILSPSGNISPEYIDGALARLRSWGYNVSEGSHSRDVYGRFAGSDEARIADLSEALSNPDVDIILCSRGGYGLQRILDQIPSITKPIIGFSDITALHQLSGLCHQPSIHGIMCKHLSTLPEDSMPIRSFRQALEGKSIEYQWASHPLNRIGDASGVLIGGNLSVLYGLQGSPYSLSCLINDIKQRGQTPILVIEDISERHYHIDRMMHNLRMSGVLSDIGGLIVGQFSQCEDDQSMLCSVYETIKKVVVSYDYPILFNAPFGHVEHNLPLWLHHHSSIHCGTNCILRLDDIEI